MFKEQQAAISGLVMQLEKLDKILGEESSQPGRELEPTEEAIADDLRRQAGSEIQL